MRTTRVQRIPSRSSVSVLLRLLWVVRLYNFRWRRHAGRRCACATLFSCFPVMVSCNIMLTILSLQSSCRPSRTSCCRSTCASAVFSKPCLPRPRRSQRRTCVFLSAPPVSVQGYSRFQVFSLAPPHVISPLSLVQPTSPLLRIVYTTSLPLLFSLLPVRGLLNLYSPLVVRVLRLL